MYNYPHYKEKDREKLVAFMQGHPFVTLIGCDASSRIEATQVPVLVEEKENRLLIYGHIARKSDHHKALLENENALVIFTGAHAYVSGAWYSGNPQQASTWNYVAVHARGRVKWTDDAGLIELLRKLSLHFENNNTASSTVYDNLPVEYREKLLKAIVGFEIEVTELDNVHKLSQNRDEKSYDNIITQLEQQGADAKTIATLMQERKPNLFPS